MTTTTTTVITSPINGYVAKVYEADGIYQLRIETQAGDRLIHVGGPTVDALAAAAEKHLTWPTYGAAATAAFEAFIEINTRAELLDFAGGFISTDAGLAEIQEDWILAEADHRLGEWAASPAL